MRSGLHGVPQVPLRLQRQPDLRVPACQRFEQERGVGADGPAALDDTLRPTIDALFRTRARGGHGPLSGLKAFDLHSVSQR